MILLSPMMKYFVVTVLDEKPYEPDLSPDSEEESDEDMHRGYCN